MTPFDFLIGSLATFRIATMISQEKGPGFIFCKLRQMPKRGSATAEGLSCPLCMSIYASAFITALFQFKTPDLWMAVPIWLALSGVSVCLSLFFKDEI